MRTVDCLRIFELYIVRLLEFKTNINCRDLIDLYKSAGHYLEVDDGVAQCCNRQSYKGSHLTTRPQGLAHSGKTLLGYI